MTTSEFRLPNLSQHILITGRNGTGKTRMALWILGKSAFDEQPFIVLDWKREEFFARSDRIRELTFRDAIPTAPGLYIIRPLPGQEDELEKWLWKVWSNGRTGLYIDEGYSIDPRSGGLQALLTQGRSLRIPIMYLSQRPSHISRFVVSEATFLSIFALNDEDDRKRVQQIVPKDRINLSVKLPEYHSYWYDVGKDTNFIVAPVPDDDVLLETIDSRLAPKRKVT